jgi:hypothetical protein
MRIAFIHEQNAFLPEVSGYIDYFSKKGIDCVTVNKTEAYQTGADVEWHFMGTSLKKNNCITIHEYTSSSIPPFASLKNFLKKQFNSKPDFRVFLSENVAGQFRFNDRIPFGFRDMGVSLEQFENEKATIEKKFDFIYIGELANRNIERAIDLFANGNLSQRSLLILSRNYHQLQGKYSSFKNIHFMGPVAPNSVAKYLLQSKFGLNLIPNQAPYNQQTSTKLLEYAAAKLPIISSEYAWVRNFQSEFGGEFFYVDESLSNINWERVNAFSYSWPDLSEWTWEYQISRSGILEFLESKFPGLRLTSS